MRADPLIPLASLRRAAPAGRTTEDVRHDGPGYKMSARIRAAPPRRILRDICSPRSTRGTIRQWSTYLPGGSATRMARLISHLNAGTQPAAFGKRLDQASLAPMPKHHREAPHPAIIESLLKSVPQPRQKSDCIARRTRADHNPSGARPGTRPPPPSPT